MVNDRWNLKFDQGEWFICGHAVASVYGAGLFYGAGCFETMVADCGYIFKFSSHYERLCKGLEYLGRGAQSIPDAGRLRELISEIIHRKELESTRCKIRLQCSLPEKGYRQSNQKDDPVLMHIAADALLHPAKKGVSLKTANTRVVPSVCKPAHLKLSNMLHYRNAFNEAIRSGFDDALLLTTRGFAAETSKANLFWMKKDRIYTPSPECDILPGIMRSSILEMLKMSFNELHVSEGTFDPSGIADADSVWITNSVIGVCSVSHLDGKELAQNRPFLNSLGSELLKYQRDRME